MDPMFDLVRDRTQDLRRTAEAARRERELRVSDPNASDHRATATAKSIMSSPASARIEAKVTCGDPRVSPESRAA